MSKTFTREEVARHNQDGDLWVIIKDFVYDLTKFAKFHPGGRQILFRYAGKDATKEFKTYHADKILAKYHDKFVIGRVDTPSEKQRPIHPSPDSFGDMIPYADPIWYQRFNSPFYKETHRVFRARIRKFVDEQVLPTMDKWKNKADPPREIVQALGKEGFLACMGGPPFPREYVDPGTPEPKDFDYFHEFILYDEISRCGHSGVIAALTNGPSIGLTAILRFGSSELKQRVAPDVLMGRKFIALAISEPQAGSDVAGLTCTARRDGAEFVLNGNKKWITNGTYADYHVVLAETGGRGKLTFLVVDKDTPGFSTRKIEIRGSDISGTAYLDFDNVRVPSSNVIGEVDDGFKISMYNFNHERFYVSVCACRLSRVCIEESIKWAMKREAFGKPLANLQSIRLKIARMGREVELLQNWLEQIAYQMSTMSHAEAQLKISDIMCSCKAYASVVYEKVARETTMVLGGNALRAGGVGEIVEGAVAQVKGYQIPAGAENVMEDFAGRTAFKLASRFAKL